MLFNPYLIALELTKKCSLSCLHCRAGGTKDYSSFQDELSTDEIFRVLNEIASFCKPIIILTGGEALLRKDIFDIIKYGRDLGLVMVLSTCGIPLDQTMGKGLKEAGIRRVSVSIDGKDSKTHDYIRGEKGVFERAIRAIDILKKNRIEFQINTTVTKYNSDQIEEILGLAIKLGASSFHPFFLIPVGNAKSMRDFQLSASKCEDILNRLYLSSMDSTIPIRPICAPFYFRSLNQNRDYKRRFGLDGRTIGCMGGKTFCFISNTGKVNICGFMDVECGDVRESSFRDIWFNSPVFNRIRDFGGYKGKCGVCEYLERCGGCRARAFERYNDYLAEEPLCIYQPC